MATFGSQFESGQRFAQGLIDTYRTARRRRQLGDIQNAQVEQTPAQFTAEDGEQLRALATARDPNGNPYYTVTPSPDGVGYQVQPNFQVNGQQAAPVGMAPRQRFQFLGQTFDQAPTQPQMDRTRLRALAGVVGEDDPVRAAGLLASMRSEDRADEQLGMTRTTFQNAQADRNERKGIETARREFVKQLQAMPDEQLADQLGSAFSVDGSGVDAMLTFDPKTKQFIFASKIPGMPSTVMSKAEAIQHAASVWEMGNGDFNTGMKMLMDGFREQRRQQERQQDLAARAAEGNASALFRNESLGLQRQQLADTRSFRAQTIAERAADRSQRAADRKADREERAADRTSRAASMRAQSTQLVEDENGNLVALTPTFNPKDGTVDYNQAPLKGLRKPGTNKTIEQQWQALVKGFGNMPAEEVQRRRIQFEAQNGIAPASELAAIRSGRRADGTPLTKEDYLEFNREYPRSKVQIPRAIMESGGASGSF